MPFQSYRSKFKNENFHVILAALKSNESDKAKCFTFRPITGRKSYRLTLQSYKIDAKRFSF